MREAVVAAKRRAGELAETVGSLTPSFPIVRGTEQANTEFLGAVQAPAPPSWLGEAVDRNALEPAAQPPISAAPPVGTTGNAPPVPLGPLMTAQRPQGVNAVFIEYADRRYFADGPAVAFDAKAFTRVGDYHGFPVFQQAGQDKTVYVSTLGGTPKLVTPYRTR